MHHCNGSAGLPASEHDPAWRNDGFTVDALNILYIFYFNLMFLIASLINMSLFVWLKLRESTPHEHETIRPPRCSSDKRPDRNGRCHGHRHPTAAKAAAARAGSSDCPNSGSPLTMESRLSTRTAAGNPSSPSTRNNAAPAPESWPDHSGYALSVTAHDRATGPIEAAAFRAACAQHGCRPRS